MLTNIPDVEISQWLVEMLPYEVMWLNENGAIIYANTKFCEKLGYSKNEVLKLNIYNLNSTTTEKSWVKHWNTVKEKGVIHFKDAHKSKSGKYYEVEVFAQFFSNNGKNFICAINNEITQSSFFKNLLYHTERIANVGGWKLNLQDGSLIVTEESLRLFNTTDKEQLLPGKVIHYFKDAEKYKALLKNTIRNAIPFDEILETNENPSRYIRVGGQAILKGNEIYKVIGVYQDVTAQQEKENSLQLFKAIIDNAEDLVYVYNRNGNLLHYSDSVKQRLGFSDAELNDFTIYDLDSSIDPSWWKVHFDDIVNNGVVRFEWSVKRKDGSTFPVDITANHVHYKGEDLNCAIVRDISDRKKKDKALYNALEEIKSLKTKLENENEYLQEEITRKINFENIICKSETYAKVLEQVDQVAPTDTTVLITGESGTGKELLARAVHNNSKRKERILIKVNCANLPKDLIESELFGHRKGAFTGATDNKVGKFSLADGGTIFLDEIGELPVDLQPKLLRVIQEGEFDELGGSKTIKVDVRIIAATNRDLEKMVKEGSFREDLFYRLNVFPIHNIPLRARKEDIPLLAQFFLEKYASKVGKPFKRLSKKTINALMGYSFPGNIRELENLIERAVIIENGTTLYPGSWLPENPDILQKDEFKTFETLQRDYIIDVLEHTNWRVSGPQGAAAILDMKDKTLFAKMKRLKIEKQISLKT